MDTKSNGVRMNEQREFGGQARRVYGRGAVRLRGGLSLGLFVGLLLSISCNPKTATVLLAAFNSDTVGSPPAAAQATGTVVINPPPGSVIVVSAPPGLPANKWVQITESSLRGNFSTFKGLGTYGMLASLFIPKDTKGLVTVAFNPDIPGQTQVNFLHLDFMPEGDVRIDDGAVRFGQYPRDKPFALSVKLIITATNASAEITLSGTGASGTKTVNVNPSLLVTARRFNAVTFFMGFQQRGTFFADDIIVTHTP